LTETARMGYNYVQGTERKKMDLRLTWRTAAVFAASALIAAAQNPGSLKNVPVPRPIGAEKYVRDPGRLVVLGKALFWDMQAGSDGRTACATCHFHAGADHRAQYQLSGAAATPNLLLQFSDFPFHLLSNTGNNRSTVITDKRQVTGSQGQ